KRPRLTLSDPSSEKESRLIGTLATPKNFENGEMFMARYIKDYVDTLFYKPALEQLRDFSMANRGAFDIVVAMMMAELGDDEFSDRIVQKPKKEIVAPSYGFYTDKDGIKRWGVKPKNYTDQFNLTVNTM